MRAAQKADRLATAKALGFGCGRSTDGTQGAAIRLKHQKKGQREKRAEIKQALNCAAPAERTN